MRDDVVLDSVIYGGTDDAFVHEILFGAIGPKAHDASGPACGEARHFLQVSEAGMIDIDTLLGWRRRRGCGWSAGAIAVLKLRKGWGTEAKSCNS